MECLVDESYECKSGSISNTLDCKDSGCCHYIKITDYFKSKEKPDANISPLPGLQEKRSST